MLFTSRATIGKVAIAGIPLTTNQGFTNFACPSDLYNRYLAHCLKWLTPQIIREAGRTTFFEIRRSKLRTFKIPIPSLVEQKEIVAHLEELIRSVKTLKSLQQKTNKYLESLGPSVLNNALAPARALKI